MIDGRLGGGDGGGGGSDLSQVEAEESLNFFLGRRGETGI
jgi:hypothetical protein